MTITFAGLKKTLGICSFRKYSIYVTSTHLKLLVRFYIKFCVRFGYAKNVYNRHRRSFLGQLSHISMRKWCTNCVYKTKLTLKDTVLFRLIIKIASDVEAGMTVLRLWYRYKYSHNVLVGVFFANQKETCLHFVLFTIDAKYVDLINLKGKNQTVPIYKNAHDAFGVFLF